MCVDLLNRNDNVLHLLSRYGVATCVDLAKTTHVVIILTLDSNAPQRQRVFEVCNQAIGQDELLRATCLLL